MMKDHQLLYNLEQAQYLTIKLVLYLHFYFVNIVICLLILHVFLIIYRV